MSLLRAMMTRHWAITSDALRQMIAVVERRNASPEMVEAELGRKLDNARTTMVRDGVAVLDIEGPLFRKASFFTEVSGATDYGTVAQDLQVALNDPDVDAILFNIDSPGGDANGVNELANMVYAARGRKPIVAYVDGMACSAAYWLASACDRIVADDLAIVGSIGVISTIVDQAKAMEEAGIKEVVVVSSGAPEKRHGYDGATTEAIDDLQRTLNALENVFVDAVARNRGVASKTVRSDFGRGGTFVAGSGTTGMPTALEAGLVDALGSFEAVLAGLTTPGRKGETRRLNAIDDAEWEAEQEQERQARQRRRLNSAGKRHDTDTTSHATTDAAPPGASPDRQPAASEDEPMTTPAIDPKAPVDPKAATPARADDGGMDDMSGSEMKGHFEKIESKQAEHDGMHGTTHGKLDEIHQMCTAMKAKMEEAPSPEVDDDLSKEASKLLPEIAALTGKTGVEAVAAVGRALAAEKSLGQLFAKLDVSSLDGALGAIDALKSSQTQVGDARAQLLNAKIAAAASGAKPTLTPAERDRLIAGLANGTISAEYVDARIKNAAPVLTPTATESQRSGVVTETGTGANGEIPAHVMQSFDNAGYSAEEKAKRVAAYKDNARRLAQYNTNAANHVSGLPQHAGGLQFNNL